MSAISMTGAAFVAVAMTLTALPVTQAQAAGCVTQGEFKRAKKGMSKASVAAVFGTRGKRDAIARSGGYVSEVRSYTACSAYGAVAVSYLNGRLTAKSAVF